MSTSFLLPARIDLILKQYNLGRFELAPKETLDGVEGEWRIINPSASVVFQGSEERCSDFVRGLVYGRTGERAVF